MFFVPYSVRLSIAGSYSRASRQLELERAELTLAYLPEVPDRCQAAQLRILRIVDTASQAPLDAAWWKLTSLDRPTGDLVLAKLVFDGREFTRDVQRVRECGTSRALYNTILHQGRIELTVEDAAQDDKPLTNLFVDLRYGSRSRDCRA